MTVWFNGGMTQTSTVTIDRYRVTYMWENESTRTVEEDHDTFELDPSEYEDLADVIAEMLGDCGKDSPSSYPDWYAGVWYMADPYRDPYTGVIEEVTYHLPRDLDETVSREVFERITARRY